MKPTTIIINQTELKLDPRGGLFWPNRQLLVVSDLHFEKGSHFAANGVPLPPHDTAETLNELSAMLSYWQPKTVISLGDSFHDHHSIERMIEADRARLTAIVAAHNWVWITGNHDGEIGLALGGQAMAEWIVGGLCFRHQAHARPSAGEISGHYHPKAQIRHRGKLLSGRCFLGDGQRLILPALGAFTGGLDVTDPIYQAFFKGAFHAHIMVRDRIISAPSRRLEVPLRLRR